MTTRILAALLVLATLSGCSAADEPAATTTTVASSGAGAGGIRFAIDETNDGTRLRIRLGDEILAHLAVEVGDAPPWRASISNPGILTAGDRIRFIPSERGQGDPYDEYLFRAVRIGQSEITLDHPRGPRTLTVTVIVSGD